ncbi:MAG: PAS domain S-box protein, partial [Candidatus Thermoplasmatota archaeon]|nr:PAS domain S-box protein [Candidatus Thermoplasmatota archaeon]
MEGSIDPGEILETGTLKLIESMEDAVLVIDMDGKILKVNESFQKITGYSEEEVVGENAVEVAKQMIKEEDQELALETLKEKTFKGKTHDPMDIKIESKGGEERYLNLRSSLIEDEEAERTLNVTIAREITDEKKMERTLEKSRKKYKKMLELSPEGIVVHQDGRLQYVNPSGAEILGIENRDEHIGKSIMKAVHPDHREEVKDRMKMMTEEGKKVPLIEEKFVRLDDGEVIDVEVAAAPIELDGKASILVIFRNISDRKEVEKTLKERERKVRDLYESTVKFERCKSKEEVFEVALQSAKNILDFYSSSIIMAEDDDLVIKATTDEDVEVGRKFPLDEGIRGLTYQNDESYLIDDLSEWEEAKPTNEKFESVISVPIGDVGVFQALSDEKGYYDEFDLEMSRVLATHIKETTERVKAEEDLKKSEQKFRSLFEASPDAIYWIDEDGYIQDVNKAFKEKLGYERERLIGTHITDAWFLDEESLEKIKEKRRRRKKGEDVGPYTIKIVDDEGNIHYSEINAHQITYNGGDRGKIVVSRDITERKEREKAIQEAKQNYEELFEKSADALYVLDPDTAEVLDINQRMCEMYGYSREEALQLTIEDTSSGEYPYTQEEAKRRVQKAKEEGPITFEWRGQKKDGTLTWEEVTLKQAEIGGQSRILASVRDITERKKAQEELNKRSEAMETSMDGIAILDENEEYVYLNEAHAEIYGYDDPDEILGKTWSVLYDEEELKRFKEEIMPTIREKGRWRGEATGIKKDGTKFPQEMSLTALEDGALICVVRDIRDRKKAEEELEKSREKYRLLTEEVNDLIVLVNLEGEFQFVNEAHKRLLGYDPEELIGNNSLELIHPDDRDRVKEQFMRGIKKGHAEGEARVSTKDGSYKWIESHGRFMPDEEQVLIVNRDITERKKRERKIEHLNSLLRSIREINQLITKKEDLDHVMKEAPKVLRETRDYSKVSIMMVEEGEVDLHIGDPDRINIEDLDSRIEELRRTEEPLTISLEEEGTRTRVLVPLIDK